MSLSKMSAISNRNLFNNCDINVEQLKTVAQEVLGTQVE